MIKSAKTLKVKSHFVALMNCIYLIVGVTFSFAYGLGPYYARMGLV